MTKETRIEHEIPKMSGKMVRSGRRGSQGNGGLTDEGVGKEMINRREVQEGWQPIQGNRDLEIHEVGGSGVAEGKRYPYDW